MTKNTIEAIQQDKGKVVSRSIQSNVSGQVSRGGDSTDAKSRLVVSSLRNGMGIRHLSTAISRTRDNLVHERQVLE